jgi:hypothetical protein
MTNIHYLKAPQECKQLPRDIHPRSPAERAVPRLAAVANVRRALRVGYSIAAEHGADADRAAFLSAFLSLQVLQ